MAGRVREVWAARRGDGLVRGARTGMGCGRGHAGGACLLSRARSAVRGGGGGICAGAWSSPLGVGVGGDGRAPGATAAGASGAVAGRGGGAAASGHGLRAARRGAGAERAGLWGRCPRGKERAGTGIGAGRRRRRVRRGCFGGRRAGRDRALDGRRSPAPPSTRRTRRRRSPVPSVTVDRPVPRGGRRGRMEARRASVLMHPPFPRTGAQPAESVRRGTRPSRARIPARAGTHPRAYLRARRLLAA